MELELDRRNIFGQKLRTAVWPRWLGRDERGDGDEVMEVRIPAGDSNVRDVSF